MFKPYRENLYYHNINFLYFYMALNDMLGLECNKLEYINTNKTIDKLFGFYYYDIEAPYKNYLSILPIKI